MWSRVRKDYIFTHTEKYSITVRTSPFPSFKLDGYPQQEYFLEGNCIEEETCSTFRLVKVKWICILI